MRRAGGGVGARHRRRCCESVTQALGSTQQQPWRQVIDPVTAWTIAIVSAVIGGVIGALVGAWITAKITERSLNKEIAARELEARHRELLDAGAELFGAVTTLSTVTFAFAALPSFSKSTRAYDLPVVMAPFQLAITTAATRLRPVADDRLRELVDDLLEASSLLVVTATRKLSKTNVVTEHEALTVVAGRLATALVQRGDIAAFALMLDSASRSPVAM